MPSATLRVVFLPLRVGPQSGQEGIPTQSVGTSYSRETSASEAVGRPGFFATDSDFAFLSCDKMCEELRKINCGNLSTLLPVVWRWRIHHCPAGGKLRIHSAISSTALWSTSEDTKGGI